MLPFVDRIKTEIEDFFVLYKPRDIVSGDFYWFAKRGDKIVISAVDCTGHGVPGAFMSMIGSEILTTVVKLRGITEPDKILELKNSYVQSALKQKQTENQDGMDMAICTIDIKNRVLEYAGARNPLIYIRDGKLFQVKADKYSIGGYQSADEEPKFTKHIIPLESSTMFYIFSDGYQDQFGGPKERKFMIKRLKDLLLDIHDKPVKEQKIILNATIEKWMINSEQTDDILVVGFRI